MKPIVVRWIVWPAVWLAALLCVAPAAEPGNDEVLDPPTPPATVETEEAPDAPQAVDVTEPAMPEEPTPANEVEPVPAPDADAPWPDGRFRRGQEIVRVLSGAVVKEGETASEIVVVFGDVEVDGTVEGDMVVVWGKLRLNGEAKGALIAPMTEVELGPKAHVHGEFISVGGTLSIDPAARIDGEQVKVSWDELTEKIPGLEGLRAIVVGLGDWVVKGPLLGRLLPHQWGWWWWFAIGASLLYLLCGLVLQRPVAAGVAVMQDRPIAAFFAGLMGYIGLCVLMLVLSLTGLGLVVVPFLFIGAVAAQFLGKVVVCQGLGLQLGTQLGVGALTRPFQSLLIGLALLTLIAVVPVMGLLVALLVAPLGFGAVLLASFQALRRERGPETMSTLSSVAAAAPSYNSVAPGIGPTAPVVEQLRHSVPPVIPSPSTSRVPAPGEFESMPRAGFWIRLAATFLDLLLVLVVTGIAGVIEFFLFFWLVYHVGLWTWRGTTIGGIVCGLKIVRRDGQPMTFPVALVRSFACVLSAVAMGLGFFWAGWSAEKVAWHDLIAGTLIVKMPRGSPLI